MKPLETRGQFVAGYIARSEMPEARQLRGGYEVSYGGRTYRRLAIRCNCGEDCCTGWQMVRDGDSDDAP
jgi:hypothetical protein